MPAFMHLRSCWRMRRRRAALLVTAFAAFAAALVPREQHWRVPPRWNPWAALTIEDEPNFLTHFKLARLERDPAACLDALKRTAFRYISVPDHTTGDGCGFRDAVLIHATDFKLRQPFMLTCPSAVALALWERHTMQTAAQAQFGQPVVALEHFGSYACRNIYARENAPRSQHATAQALDVAGFVLADGQRITIAAMWADRDSAASRFLHQLRDGACDYFDAVLGPDYNAAHRDHLHLDRGAFRACR